METSEAAPTVERKPSYYSYDLEEKLFALSNGGSGFFNGLRELSSRDLTVGLFQREGGFYTPVLVREKEGLGLRASHGASLSEIRSAIGSRRLLQVFNSRTLSSSDKTFKELHKFLELPKDSREGEALFASVQFQGTKLEGQVTSPRIVRLLDWADKAWPPHLRETHFPNTQKTLWIASEGAFVNFRIHPGGSSTWIHAHTGSLTLFLIPPTDEHLKNYEDWLCQNKQSHVFFPDMSKNILKVDLLQGSTLFIPGGWMHASWNPKEDSLLFGGTFLHSFGIEKQLQVAFMEESAGISPEDRYPHLSEMLWYVLDRYITRLLGRTHLDLPEEEKRRMKLERGENIDPNREVLFSCSTAAIEEASSEHLTQAELQGIKFIVMYLHQLPPGKKSVPLMLPDPIGVIKDVRRLVLEHKEDCPEKAISSKYILRWTENDDVDNFLKKSRKMLSHLPPIDKKTVLSPIPPPSSGGATGNRRRRVRCKVCAACMGGDCQACAYCKDMLKYGGQGKMKQTCEKRRCLQPQLPICAFCSVCNLDGWFGPPKLQTKESERPEYSPNLFECTVCLEIIHPGCAEKSSGHGRINNELCNSWECANCLNSGFGTAPSRIRKRKLSDDEYTAAEENYQEEED